MPSIIPPGVALRLEAGAFGLVDAVVPFVKTATRSGRLLLTDMTEYIPEEVWRSRDRIQQVQTQRLRELLAAVSEGNSFWHCLLYTSPSPRDLSTSRMPSSA